SPAWKSPTRRIGPMSLRPTALSRVIPWGARATANGVYRRKSSASIVARMTAAATRYGLPAKRLSSDARVRPCRGRAFFKSRALVDDRTLTMACSTHATQTETTHAEMDDGYSCACHNNDGGARTRSRCGPELVRAVPDLSCGR